MENNNALIEEAVKVIRPANKNKIWNEQDYDVITTQDNDGNKLVILREKKI